MGRARGLKRRPLAPHPIPPLTQKQPRRKTILDPMPITESQSKPQRRFAPNDLIGFLRKTDRHQIGTVIGIVGIASYKGSATIWPHSCHQIQDRSCIAMLTKPARTCRRVSSLWSLSSLRRSKRPCAKRSRKLSRRRGLAIGSGTNPKARGDYVTSVLSWKKPSRPVKCSMVHIRSRSHISSRSSRFSSTP